MDRKTGAYLSGNDGSVAHFLPETSGLGGCDRLRTGGDPACERPFDCLAERPRVTHFLRNGDLVPMKDCGRCASCSARIRKHTERIERLPLKKSPFRCRCGAAC